MIGAEGSCINEFAFSPCGTNLAAVSQDGFLRVFHYDTMEAIGRARSYFGGFLCVCWSPDGKYVVVGGEDDLITVWSFAERRVVARGQGHRSWVSVVAFDPYAAAPGDADGDGEGREAAHSYRLGSVSQDTQLCLWDLTEDVLRPVRARASMHLSPQPEANGAASGPGRPRPKPKAPRLDGAPAAALSISVGRAKDEPGVASLTQRLAGFSFGERRSEHRRHFSLAKAERPAAPRRAPGSPAAEALRLMGTPACPRFDECPVLEPLLCKKVAHERLTALLFRAEYFVTACADGCVNTWARPRSAALNGRRDERLERVERPERVERLERKD